MWFTGQNETFTALKTITGDQFNFYLCFSMRRPSSINTQMYDRLFHGLKLSF